MNKLQNLLGSLFVVTVSATALSVNAQTSTGPKAAQFRQTESTLQSEASNRPVFERVNPSAPASDPVGKATTPAQKRARFVSEEATLQAESRNVPAYSPIPKTAAADPYPKATTQAARKAQFATEEKILQQEATP